MLATFDIVIRTSSILHRKEPIPRPYQIYGNHLHYLTVGNSRRWNKNSDCEIPELKVEIQDGIQRSLHSTLYRQALNGIHREAITTFTKPRLRNGVVGDPPPPIAEEELQLPRKTHVTAGFDIVLAMCGQTKLHVN
ncbi:uncharacterized protein LOC118742991 [Rhagoletis pomonella]|uniref:uncharacterized protein LOC118742991 n=1 Tax=Rhagoletis pomonella TaxID=28610 RepID=UPI001784AAA4|nr:uncharacterized protein LOC118742991 [Rhagoletis pomonella]